MTIQKAYEKIENVKTLLKDIAEFFDSEVDSQEDDVSPEHDLTNHLGSLNNAIAELNDIETNEDKTQEQTTEEAID